MSEVTVFEDRFVAKFVVVGAVLGLMLGLSNSEEGVMFMIAMPVMGAVLALLVFGATIPLYAWYKHFRAKGSSRFEAVLLLIGGLVAGLMAGLVYGWLTDNIPLLKGILTIFFLVVCVALPWTWVWERKQRAKLNVIDVKE